MVEIMAPVGSFESLAAAIDAGANSVYFGIEQLNMRANAANNFTTEDLKKIVATCKKNNVRTYLTINTVLYDHDMILMKQIIDVAKKEGVSAIIASDLAAIQYAHNQGVEVHISTQANICNVESVKFYSHFADVVVLARELTLSQIKYIADQIKVQDIRGPNNKLIEIELFVHGAMCVAISGKCHMSLATYNSSANRGACLQNCRRSYKVTDDETGDELVIDNKYVMSPKDMCTIEFIDKLMDAGVQVLKIEGRGKSAEYVKVCVESYKEAVSAVEQKAFTSELAQKLTLKLQTVYNRGFWKGGYYLGKKLGEWSGTYGSQATKVKQFIGLVDNYYTNQQITSLRIETGELNCGDNIIIIGKTTGVSEDTVNELWVDNKKVPKATKNQIVTFKSKKARKGDKVYIWKNA